MSHPMDFELYKNIPITKDMQMSVVEITENAVTLKAPLQANLNHHQTAFGGSIYSLAVLSCWILVHHTVKELNQEMDYIVIQNGNMDYLNPITNEFYAKAQWENEEDKQDFLNSLKRKKRARLNLNSIVTCEKQTCAQFAGRFVAGINTP